MHDMMCVNYPAVCLCLLLIIFEYAEACHVIQQHMLYTTHVILDGILWPLLKCYRTDIRSGMCNALLYPGRMAFKRTSQLA